MYDFIANYVASLWTSTRRTKETHSGWVSGNACCCIHNGETQDTRGRGGVIVNNGSVTYKCFNCNFKASYTPGHQITFNLRRLLKWMGASESDVERLILESHRIKQNIDPFEIQQREEELSFIPNFDEYVLPDDFISFTELFKLMETNPDDIPEEAYYAIKYVIDRKVDINKYEFYWTPTDEYKFRDRLYVPFYWKNKIVGYTGRTLDVSNNVKYLNLMPQNYVFNIDKQLENSEIVIVAEGIFDALSIDGVAVMHNHISDEQAKLIEYLGKEIIVVPDFDKKAGVGLIQDAIKHGWPVSFPLWADNCKDINEAIVKYGKLFVLKCIIDAVEKNELKIKLKTRSKFGPNKV